MYFYNKEIRPKNIITRPTKTLSHGTPIVCTSLLFCLTRVFQNTFFASCKTICWCITTLLSRVLQTLSSYRKDVLTTGWSRPIGCLISWFTFCRLATNYRALFRKMTYKHKASYESLPLCTKRQGMPSFLHLDCHFLNLPSPSIVLFSQSLLPRCVEKRPMRV